jgi:arylsulfatase A
MSPDCTHSISEEPVIGYDLFPTFAEIGGGGKYNGETIVDGMSLLPLFIDPKHSMDRSLYWHFPYYHPEGNKFGNARPSIGVDDFSVSQTRPQSAIRRGDYKLMYFEEDQRSELYDLRRDLSEQIDVSLEEPAIARALKSRFSGI